MATNVGDNNRGTEVKKFEICPFYLSEGFSARFRRTLLGSMEMSTPFPHFSLPSFLKDKKSAVDLRDELLKAEWSRKENDLYSLSQTDDLSSFDANKFPTLISYRDFIAKDVRKWLENASGIKLNEKVSLTGSLYKFTDLLLPHDDQLEARKFAFILYLVDDWREEDGGQLKIYNCDERNHPVSVAKEILPAFNMFNIFEVSPRSWHMVGEVLSPGANRLSINGWFYADDVVPTPPLLSNYIRMTITPHMDITLREVEEWINPLYLTPTEQMKVRRVFEEGSEINLTQFLRKEKYDEVLKALKGCQFDMVGPPNRRQMWDLQGASLERNRCIDSLMRLCSSRAMTVLLSQWTGLPLHPLIEDNNEDGLGDSSGGDLRGPSPKRMKLDPEYMAEEADIDDSKDPKTMEVDPECGDEQPSSDDCKGVTCTVAMKRLSMGCYTIADDQLAFEANNNGYTLDLQLFLGSEDWPESAGGFTSYIAENEEKEVLRVYPVANSAALVYREPDVFPFVKYVNSRARNRSLYVLKCSYFGARDEDSEEDSVSSAESGELSGDEGSDDNNEEEADGGQVEDDGQLGEREDDGDAGKIDGNAGEEQGCSAKPGGMGHSNGPQVGDINDGADLD
uniref:2-oxoglutarate and iron-dependent oxygenase domain-containing protein 1 n=1 Tax=Ascaris suum TaxID=6253 RepID=F1KZR8_ASCSU